MKQAALYQKFKNKIVRCQVCQRRCFIGEDKVGFCQSRLNKEGKLYTLLYGITNSPIQIDPIEKKPFYHFKPGSLVASIGSFGCNFRCRQCLNWWCSWGEPAMSNLKKFAKIQDPKLKANSLRLTAQNPASPSQLVKTIVEAGYQGIAFTYNEPVIWIEFTRDLAALAKKAGLYTVFVTKGSWTKETLDYSGPYLDAANIDFKGFSEKTYQKMGAFFGQIPKMAKYAQEKHQIHLEITTLLIPGINDDPKELEKMTEWIVKYLGPDTPWHLSQFDPEASPDKQFQKIPFTLVEQLQKAAEIGKKTGLNHIYIWAPNDFYSRGDLICPKCQKVCLKRSGWEPTEIKITKEGRCQFCEYKLKVVL